MIDTSENLHLFEKDKLKSYEVTRKSLMPAYNSLSKDDLENLVGYLSSLRQKK